MSSNGKALFMAVKLLVFGLPGSGKSTIARHITTYLKDRNWESTHFSDHVILKEMFLADSEGKLFQPTDHGGFDILDLNALDTALQVLEQAINQHLLSPKQEEIVLIEFSRNDYLRAFQQFSDTFLQDAHFLHLDVETETCKSRIRERTANPSTKDDFFVSEYIFNTYYYKDDGQEIPQILERNYRIDQQKVARIDNNGSLLDSVAQINQFVDTICGLETLGNT
jgi:adenylate kinase family enzyme